MTQEDLDQIRRIVAETVAEAEARLKANQDRAVEAIAHEISARSAELGQRIDGLSQRMDNLAPVIISADTRMAAFTRSMDRLVTDHVEREAQLAAQGRALEQLTARVKAIEDRIAGRQ